MMMNNRNPSRMNIVRLDEIINDRKPVKSFKLDKEERELVKMRGSVT